MTAARRTLSKLLEPLRTRVAGMIARAAVKLVDDGKRAQELQLTALAGEVLDRVERLQDYGMSSRPLGPDGGGKTAEALVLFVGGGRDHPVAVAVEDRRHRPRNLAAGEVTLYDDRGAVVHLSRSELVLSDPDAIRLEVGSSSIVVEDGQITITSPSIDFEES